MKPAINKIFRYFMEGVMILVPFVVTLWLILWAFQKVSSLIEELIEYFTVYIHSLEKLREYPVLSTLATIGAITILGYIASNFIIRSFINLMESIVMSVPLINILYSYIKESTSAFVDKFDKPVLVLVNEKLDIRKIGFITQDSLINLDIEEKVAIYLPHSYSFSGELIFIDRAKVTPMSISTTDALRIILSGGLAEVKRPPLLKNPNNQE